MAAHCPGYLPMAGDGTGTPVRICYSSSLADPPLPFPSSFRMSNVYYSRRLVELPPGKL